MSASDAMEYPIYNCKYRVYIPLVDTDGALIALNSGDTELGKDSATASDATNELTEGTTGICSLDLTYAEMAYSAVEIVPKSTGAITVPFTIYPRRYPTLASGTAQTGGAGTITLAATASAVDGVYTGCYVRASNNDPAGIQGEVRIITGYTGSTKVATVAPNWENTPTIDTTYEILLPTDIAMATQVSSASDVVDEMETQMAADPTGFKMNVMEVNGTSQTANDNGADINAILSDTATDGVLLSATAIDDIWDETMHNSITARQLLGITLAAFAAGKTSGGDTATVTFRDTADGFDAVVMTVDEDGNRSEVVLSFS